MTLTNLEARVQKVAKANGLKNKQLVKTCIYLIQVCIS